MMSCWFPFHSDGHCTALNGLPLKWVVKYCITTKLSYTNPAFSEIMSLDSKIGLELKWDCKLCNTNFGFFLKDLYAIMLDFFSIHYSDGCMRDHV